MRIIRYYECGCPEHWLEEIGKSDWSAGKYLHDLLAEGTFRTLCCEGSEVLILTDGDALISFCTLAEKDDIQPTELMPWIGFAYTFPQYRGHHYLGKLLEEADRIAAESGFSAVYISTDHTGLYESYGCEYLREMTDIHGNPSRVYIRRIDQAAPQTIREESGR